MARVTDDAALQQPARSTEGDATALLSRASDRISTPPVADLHELAVERLELVARTYEAAAELELARGALARVDAAILRLGPERSAPERSRTPSAHPTVDFSSSSGVLPFTSGASRTKVGVV